MPPFNPDPVGHPTFRPQFPLRGEDLRIISQRAAASQRSAATGSDNDIGAGVGYQAGPELVPDGFWARLTTPALVLNNKPIPLYSFYENQDDGTGYGWTDSNGAAQGTNAAHEINDNTAIPVPGPPLDLVGGPFAGESFWYVVTAVWKNAAGVDLQSAVSNEVGLSGGYGELSWTAPASASGFTLAGYQVWRGRYPGGENVLVATLSAGATTYTDVGGGTDQYPIPGGNAGPLVWMSPRSTDNYYKFSYGAASLPLAWVRVTASTYSVIYLGRTDMGCTVAGNQLTDAALTSADVGATVVQSGTAIGTIQSVNTSVTPPVATMSASGTNGTNLSVVISAGHIQGYAATVMSWDSTHGGWTLGTQNVWFYDPNMQNGIYSAVYSLSYAPFECIEVGTDASGTLIYALGSDPGVQCATSNPSSNGFIGSGPIIIYGFNSQWNPGYSGQITIGYQYYLFGFVLPSGGTDGADLFMAPGPTASSQGVVAQAYQGDSGTDGMGNQFINGVNVSIGNNTASLTPVTDFGTWSS